MTNSTKNSPPLQAPSFEEALHLTQEALWERMKITDKQIDLINKRLDILDQVVLNIPKEEK